MTGGANADGKRRENIEAEDSLRTVECLRGRLLAERVASRNAKEESEQMENKLIELEKKLKEESKSRNRAEKKLKFLIKKLKSLNISCISDESEQSASGLLENSEMSSIVSSVASSSTKEAEDKQINANVTNSIIGETQEFIQNSKSPSVPENLQQSVSSSAQTHENLAAGKTICSTDGVNLPELTIQKEEIEEFKKKSEPSTVSNNSEQNASSSAKTHDNPAAGETICSTNGVNLNELTIQKEEMEEFKEKPESPTVSNNSKQNASSSAKNHDNPAAGETIGSRNGVNFPELTMEEMEEFKEKSESPTVSNNSEQNSSSSAKNHDNPAAGETIGSGNGVNFPELTMKKEEIEEFKKSESLTVSNNSEKNASSSAKNHDNPAAGETIVSRNGVNFPELTMKKEEIEEFKKSESPTVSNNSEKNDGSSAKNHENPVAGETVASRNGVNFSELTMKEDIEEFKVKTESPTVSFKSEQNTSQSSTINQCHGSSTTQLETCSIVDAHSAKSNEPESSRKAKKDDHSLRSLFKKENLNEDDNQEQDDQVDNSLALVPVDLPKTKRTIDPAILDATVKEVLDALRNAKEKLQTSTERRRSNMIKVG